MARTARTAIRSNALEEWSCQVDSVVHSAVGLRRATRIWEKDSIGDERERLPSDDRDRNQHCHDEEYGIKRNYAPSPPTFKNRSENSRHNSSKSGLPGWKGPHQTTSYGATGALFLIF
jgi:hypothetical protein